MARLHVVAACALIAAQAVRAQDRQPPRFQSGVEIVTVDVTVVDDEGRPVLNLQPPDFEVEVDGVGRRVVTAEWVPLVPQVSAAPANAASPVAPPPLPVPYTSNERSAGGRFIVLLIDRLNIRLEGLLAHRDTINAFIDGLQPSDRLAVVSSGVGAGPSVPFTTNHESAKDALPKIAGQSGLQGRSVIMALRDLLIALKPIDAPKTIVLISEGFSAPAEAVQDDRRPYLVEIEHLAAEARTIVYAMQLAPRITDLRQSRQDTRLGPDLTEPAALERRGAARSQGGAPAGFDDPRTMPGPANAAAPDRVEGGGGLYSIAAVTGGSMFTAVMNADHVFARINSEISGYYLLGVEADPSHKDGKPHAIKVDVPRPGVTIRSRRQLVVTPAGPPPRTPEDALVPAFASPAAMTALPLRVSTFAMRGPSGRNVQVLVHAEAGDGYLAAKTVVLGYLVTDRNDRVLQKRAGNSTLQPALRGRASPLQVTTSVTLEPGDYTLKLAVADGDRVGSVEHPIRAAVAGEGPVAFSDLIVGGSAAAKPAIPPPVGSTIRQDYLQGFLEAYGVEARGLTARFDVATAPDGPALASVPVTAAAAGGDRVLLSQVVSIRQLAPGRYVLRAVIAIPGGEPRTIVRAFEKAD